MSETIDVVVPRVCKLPHVGFTLPNGLKVVVVSDPETEQSTAGMAVRVGSNYDPPELPGLAHLLEHMLFLGTERNPGEGEYNKYMAEHGGHDNAWTEDNSTLYYFSCSDEAFDEGLEMFLHFFVCPLLTESGLEREVQAVHSEDEKNHSVDYWCAQEVKKLHLCNPAHGYGRYGNGNSATLWDGPRAAGVDVRAALVAFYEKYYVAGDMALTVFSRRSVEQIHAAVAPILARVRPGTNAAYGTPECPPLRVADRGPGAWVNLQTNRSTPGLTLLFPLPYGDADHDAQPARYAMHVLGHECEGTLFSVLLAEGLATELSAGYSRPIDEHHSVFTVSMGLTTAGVRSVDRVAALCFEAMEHLRRAGVDDRTFAEMVSTAQLAFEFAELSRPTDHVARIARHANLYGIEHAWSSQYVVPAPDKAQAAAALQHLTPDNCVFLFGAPDIAAMVTPADADAAALPVDRLPVAAPASQQTVHHGAHFGIAQLPPSVLAAWAAPESLHPKLATPPPNPFIATTFDPAPLGTAPYPAPQATPYGTLWTKVDDRFSVPKATAVIDFQAPPVAETAAHHFFTSVLTHMVHLALTDVRYFAELGALESDLHRSDCGIELRVSGPLEKQPQLIEALLARLLRTEGYTAQQYAVSAEHVLQRAFSARTAQPYQWAWETAVQWATPVRWQPDDLIDAAAGPGACELELAAAAQRLLPFADFEAFVRDVLWKDGVHYEALWHGSFAEAPTPAVIDAALRNAGLKPCSPGALPKLRRTLVPPSRAELAAQGSAQGSVGGELRPPTGCLRVRRVANLRDPNAAVVLSLSLGMRMPPLAAQAAVLEALISAPFFETLRTVETLGYVVYAALRPLHGVLHLVLCVQSSKYGGEYCLARILAFLEALPAVIRDVTPEQFADVVRAQVSARRNKPKSLASETLRLWADMDHPAGFDHREQVIAELERLTLADVAGLVATVAPTATEARCVAVMLLPSDDAVAALSARSGAHRDIFELPLKEREGAAVEPQAGQLALPTMEAATAAFASMTDLATWRTAQPLYPDQRDIRAASTAPEAGQHAE